MSQKQPVDTRPIQSIMNIKSNEDLRNYLEERPELNLSLMKQKNGSTLLHYAAFKNELSKLKIYILHFQAFARQNLRHSKQDPSFQNQLRAWINVQNKDGITALHFAGLHGNIEMIEFLERYGANMQATTNQQEDLQFMAVENNHLKTLVYLLQHRPDKIPFDPKRQNHQGDTPLHKAAAAGYTSIVSYLLTLPPTRLNKDARNNEGWTALMLAVKGGHKDTVKRLLLKGADRHIKNNQEQQAIDLAGLFGKNDIVRILRDDFTRWERIKIACNYKLVYEVEKPTVFYCVVFLIMFHILYLPSQILSEVTIFDSPYPFYAISALLYLVIIILFILLTKKHPKKKAKDLLQVQLPACVECRESARANEFHCFICGSCIWRYDHHCPWINNCVSAFNIGKFILFLILLILASAEVLFMSLALQIDALPQITTTTLIPIDQGLLDTLKKVNLGVCGTLAVLSCLSLFNLLGDQLKNLCSNSTSYQRAKNLNKESLLTSNHSTNNESALLLEQQEFEDEEEGCLGNCCKMLKQDYAIE